MQGTPDQKTTAWLVAKVPTTEGTEAERGDINQIDEAIVTRK